MSGLRGTILASIQEIGDCSGCHQLPERSFFYKGHQFPVCARCTGVFIGQAAAVMVSFFTDLSVRLSILFLSVMGIDWLIQESGLKQSTNRRRLMTGILGGFGLFSLYCMIFKKIIRILK